MKQSEIVDTNKIKQEIEENQEEIGGRGGLDPTRYGDWEKNGRVSDF